MQKKLSTTESPVLMQAAADIFKDTTIDNLAFFLFKKIC